ncbi:SGNH hydrolase [Thozetella sp. PMI_491]|nr:SGNH hydrolase [Thozetella sp. PMI_491]
MRLHLLVGVLPMLATAAPTAGASSDTQRCSGGSDDKPPAFFLAGDSTTAVQSSNGGGWGNGFLGFLKSPAWGVNKGHNGATTVSFVNGGDWAQVLGLVKNNTAKFDVFVTIQFGHNDQKAAANITMPQFQANLVSMAKDVKSLGGTPIIVTSLTRRTFNGTVLVDSLTDVVTAARAAAGSANVALLDLNAASYKYVSAIGQAAADKYDLVEGDRTHLNDWGSVVFGRIVADLLVGQKASLGKWIRPNETLSSLINQGLPA